MFRILALVILVSTILLSYSCRPRKKVMVKAPPTASKPVAKKTTPPKSITPIVVAKPKATADTILYEPADLSAPLTPKREFRAVWIATVENIDWPSKKGLPTAQQQQEMINLLDTYYKTGFNAVIMQVRAAADAFYAKSAEPWSEWLTGQQGKAPEPFYDPMEFIIQESHNRGLEFHAWLNLDRATFSKTASIAHNHISQRRPEWFMTYGNRKLFNLGLPEVRSYIAGIVANIVRNYDVDGIHFDDYFYPYAIAGQVIRDDAAYRQHYNGMSREDWRRSNVDKLILELRDSVRLVKPYVKFGISPFGIWKNQKSDPEGSATNGGQAYYELYADTRKWAREGWVDYIAPQIYFTTEFERANYRTLVDWWKRNSGDRHLYIGHGAYRVGNTRERDPAWMNPRQVPGQVTYNRAVSGQAKGNVHGSIYFSGKSIINNPLGIRDTLQRNLYRFPALIPPMPWIDSIAPLPPRDLKAARYEAGVELYWQAPEPAKDGSRAHYYVIYRFEGRYRQYRTDNPQRILAVCPGEDNTRFFDKTADPKKHYTYLITTFDRLHNESMDTQVWVN